MGGEPQDPWLELRELCREGDPTAIARFVGTLPATDVARVLSILNREERISVLTALVPGGAAEVLEALSPAQASGLVEELPAPEAATILETMGTADQADLLGELSEKEAEAILEEMGPEEAREARELLAYPADSAGGLMETSFLRFAQDSDLVDVFRDLRENGEAYSDYAIQYGYVVSRTGSLVGVLRLRDLLFAKDRTPVSEAMIPNPLSVSATATVEDLQRFFQEHAFLGVPVVDVEGRPLGVVERAAVDAARGEEAEETLLKVAGIVGGEELRSMPLHHRSIRRLSWLSTNIVLNVIAASVIAFYEDTLRSVIALAVFLPIISDMSGCSGNQAVTVSIRELALGLVTPRELRRVLAKEVGIGLVNGLVLGAFLGLLASLWKGNPYLGLVVGGALALNTIVSVSLGGVLPLLLKRMEKDPALASAPILTTVTDLLGFLAALGFATALLPRLAS